MVDVAPERQAVAHRALVPTDREQALGRAAEDVRFDAPHAVAGDGGDADRPRFARVGGWMRKLDPRLIDGPLLPMFAISFVTTIEQWNIRALSVLFPEIQADLGLSLAAVALVSTIVVRAATLSRPFFGWLADRRSRVWMLRTGSALTTAGYALTAATGGLGGFATGRVAEGVGVVVADPAGYTLLPDTYKLQDRFRVIFFLFRVVGVLGIVALPVIGLVSTAYGWRAVFWGLAAAAAVVTLLLFRVRDVPRGYWERKSLGASDEVAATEQQPVSWKQSWRATASIGFVRRQWLAAPFLAVANQFLLLFTGIYFAQEYGIGPGGRAVIEAIKETGGLIGLVVFGEMASRLIQTKPRTVVAMQAFQGVSIAAGLGLLLVAPNIQVAVVIVALMQLVATTIFPLQFGLLSLVVPPRVRGFGIQTIYFWSFPAFLLAGLAGGEALVDRGLDAVVLAVIPFCLIASVVVLTAMPLVERDIRAGRLASMADEEARLARAAGRDKMLVCRGVDVAYDGVQVLFGVDLDVEQGEIVALLGTNGAGKSTLLNAIAGLRPATSGAVFLDGRDITHAPAHENAASGVVVVPGGRAVCASLTVEENLRTAAWLHRADEEVVAQRTAAALQLFPRLRERLGQRAGDLSGGEQQMLAVAQAYLMEPRLLMIDELSLGLAPQVVEDLLESLRAINATGTTILLVEQSLNVALTIARRAVFMDKGEIRFDGSTEQLLQRPDLVRAVFMGSAARGRPLRRRVAPGGEAERLLEIEHVSLSFGGVRALDDVSLTLRPREVVGIIGPNGAGKTTLFDVVSGLVEPAAGRVVLKGVDVTGLGLDGRAVAGLGRSFQNARLFPSMTVRENVAIGLHKHFAARNPLLAAAWAPPARSAERRVRARVDDVVELLGLQAYADKFVGELSTGTRRAVDVACIMMASPDVLLLDEPSSGLAQAEAEALGPVILRLVRETGCGVLVIEHDLPLVTSVSDRLVAMELGRVIATGSPDEVVRDPEVQRAYLSASKEVVLRSGAVLDDALAAAGLTAGGTHDPHRDARGARPGDE